VTRESRYLFAADALLVVHALFVAFVVLVLPAIYLGRYLRWSWVRNYRLRLAHLVSIAFVVLETWAGVLCPLTVWEAELRRLAGNAAREGSFVQFWLQELLFYDAQWWVFIVAYTTFGLLVVLSWFHVPPQRGE